MNIYFVNRPLLLILSIIIILPAYSTLYGTQRVDYNEQQKQPTNTGSVIDFSDLVSTHSSAQNAIDYLLKQEMVILKFYATWCPPCRQLSPCFASVARQYSHVLCVEINTEQYPQTSALFHIKSLPSLIFLYKGVNIGFRSGFRNQKVLENDINTIFSKHTQS